MKKMHLICNAHLDPVWQWQWEEGVGATISTFRVAAQLCDQYDSFVFNHNEAILYQWIERFEPKLFADIQRLVAEGKWHIMGGWYLQPDCNMLNGESFVRQITQGLSYFKEKFGVRPTSALNFDPFGHTKGLVQILEKCGYDSYIITRPRVDEKHPERRFVWEGFDNTSVIVSRPYAYNTPLGKADVALGTQLVEQQDEEFGILLWGVGNHGGGPSKEDLKKLTKMIEENTSVEIVHSTPEEFFKAIAAQKDSLPVYTTSLQHAMVGCYTSQVRIKQHHRRLEQQLSIAERMASHAHLAGLMDYPTQQLQQASEDLMFAQFHDILPGSSIQTVEEDALRLLNHGEEIASNIKTEAFFKLSEGQPQAENGRLPILVYNPLPYEATQTVECEFMLADQNYNDEFTNPIVYQGDQRLPSQAEKEASNLPLDWRKRVVFEAKLKPSSINRFDVDLEILPEKPKSKLVPTNGCFEISNSLYSAKVNVNTGLLDSYNVGNTEYLKQPAGEILVLSDIEDPWYMHAYSFRDVIGRFTLATPEQTARICNVKAGALEPVRIVEDGEVRTVIEAVFVYESSQAVVQYFFPKNSTNVHMKLRLIFSEKNRMLKLSFPTTMSNPEYFGKTAFGVDSLLTDGSEVVAQEYVLATDGTNALSIVNTGTYGSSMEHGEIRMSLLRSACYCAHPIGDRATVPQNRFNECIDIGERLFDFYLNASSLEERKTKVETEAACVHQSPLAVCFFPPDTGTKPLSLCEIDNQSIQMTAFKKALNGDGYIARFHNAADSEQSAKVKFPVLNIDLSVNLRPFEVQTFRILNGEILSCSLCEDL